MSNSRVLLPLSALALVVGLFWAIPAAVAHLGRVPGLALVIGVYWFGFCLPLGLAFGGAGGRWWGGRLPWAVPGLALALAGAVWLRHPDGFALAVVGLAIVAAAINGPIEELYWRGAWARVFAGNRRMQALGLALFVGWHVPLALHAGLPFPGGVWGLTAGALAAGAFWAWLVRRHGLGWAMLSHALTNAIVFAPLFQAGFTRIGW